jgi:signal transduction histidine kinase
MLMPTSSEFVALCRSQVALLTQTLGATLTVVYLTEDLVEGAETRLVPIVAFPETPRSLEQSFPLALSPTSSLDPVSAPLVRPRPAVEPSLPPLSTARQTEPRRWSAARDQPSWSPQRQLVLPLMHENMVLGLLVTERDDRGWIDWERSQIERIAHTLALACVLDQRAQWLDQTHHEHRLLQAQQHDLMDNLLHQFRNPLTALRTFGKLLMKRLQPGESNYDVASSIVRESDRLQSLLKQFDQAIDLTHLEPLPLTFDTPSPMADPVERVIPLLPSGSGVLTVTDLQLAPTAVDEILQAQLVTVAAIAQEKGLRIYTAIPPHLPLVWANEAALCEVLSNLLDNALKYTPTGEALHIRVDAVAADQLLIRISDTGNGIPSQDLPHLFERHYRGIQAQTTIPGTGLGLAIAYSLIQQMHGDIQVFSPMQPEGWASNGTPISDRGTTFAVRLGREIGSRKCEV